jgi:hypothetical protein
MRLLHARRSELEPLTFLRLNTTILIVTCYIGVSVQKLHPATQPATHQQEILAMKPHILFVPFILGTTSLIAPASATSLVSERTDAQAQAAALLTGTLTFGKSEQSATVASDALAAAPKDAHAHAAALLSGLPSKIVVAMKTARTHVRADAQAQAAALLNQRR